MAHLVRQVAAILSQYVGERMGAEMEEQGNLLEMSCWGAPGRHCAQDSPLRRSISPIEHDIGNRLEERFPGLHERVEKAVREANTQLREALRAETGLKLSTEKTRQNVPVRVVNGIPQRLLDILVADAGILDLHVDLALFRDAGKGIEQLLSRYGFLEKWPPMAQGLAQREEFKHCRDSLMKLAGELEAINPFAPVWKIEEDVLGAYFFHQGHVEIYWMPIGLIAADLDVSPEVLTQVVLAHELAHAYTHMGFDIDDQTWNTRDFAASSLEVVEGVAQFFTEAVCRRLIHRWPDALDAYRALLEKQTGPYRAHLDWIPKDEAAGEAVRNALIQFRSSENKDHEDFKEMVSHFKNLLGRREKQLGEIMESKRY